MKFTHSWLKEHIDLSTDQDTLLERLSLVGLEVEDVDRPGEALGAFVVGHVIEAQQHPNADKLQLCTVDIGAAEPMKVVCGAPNARVGLKTVFAPLGATIPANGMVLKPTKIRGVESFGMLCSTSELSLDDAHDGIMELSDSIAAGTLVVDALGLDDTVVTIAITPNRCDCLGVRGIARDVAAMGLGEMKPLEVKPVKGEGECPIRVTFDFPEEHQDACPIFASRLIRGVKNGPSPQWLQDRLRSVGLRPISALVDITNFFTVDRCRPLHVFDASKVTGNLVLRLSKGGETMDALNDRSYTLEEGMVVIDDDAGTQSLAGVIGGAPTGVSEETVDVLLECAHFEPVRTAMTGRKLKIESDARYRFERGVDPESVIDGVEAATQMILDLCGGAASELQVTGAVPEWRRTLQMRISRVATLGGLTLPADEVRRILETLGCELTDAGEDRLDVAPPPWRSDIEGEADLVEEVLRIHGYDNIPPVAPVRVNALPRPALSQAQSNAARVRRTLAARGMTEAVSWSFMDSETAALFGEVPESLRIDNPISANLDLMRTTLMPNLLQAVGRNDDRDQGNGALFEVGPQYANDTPKGQSLMASGARSGQTSGRHWGAQPRPVDVFDVKADAMAVVSACGFDPSRLQVVAQAPAYYHPGRSGRLQLGPKNVMAYFGEVHPATLKALGIKGPVVAFEVNLTAVPRAKKGKGQARPLLKRSPYQAVTRDFAFTLDRDVSAEKVIRAAKSANKALIEAVEVFDVYAGENIEAGKKSLAISVRIQPVEGTMTDEEIDKISHAIVERIVRATNGLQR